MTDALDALQRRRLRWRARRGLLENDIVLTRFLDRHEAGLGAAEVAALGQLLDLTDNELLDLLLARAELPRAIDNPDTRTLLGQLRAI
jgi:antitoxin CptB